MKRISVADYFVEFLIANNVTDVFGYQGGMIAYIFDSLGRYRDRINYHSCATEQGAALAACSYAQATHNLGVAISTSGPGFTNLLTGMANAWFDSLPVLFVSGNVNTKDKKRGMRLRQLGFQEIQASSISKDITKKTYEIELDTDYISCFNEAYIKAMSDRKGPVYLDLPINVCREMVEIDTIGPVVRNEIETKNSSAELVVNDLIHSKKPVIIAGAGIKQANCVQKFRQLINALQIPVVTTLPGIDVLSSESKYMMGYIGGTARREAGIVLQNADFVLSIGTRLCSKQVGHNLSLFAPRATKFYRLDIDDAEFERKIKEDEIQIKEDIVSFVGHSLRYLNSIGYNSIQGDWINRCSKMCELLSESDMTVGNLIIKEVTSLLPDNANIVLDVGKNLIYGGQSAIINDDTELFMSAGLGTMGYAIPAAIGAFYGNENPTYVITGDGGAQMNIQELNTIIKNGLPIKIIVLNNNALGNIRSFQEQYLDSRYVATSEAEGDYFSCDFSALAKAYGLNAYKITNFSDIENYREILDSNKSVLLEIIYRDCDTLPSIVAGGNFLEENKGISKELIEEIKIIMQ